MAVATSTRSIAMTEQQRTDFEEKGFILIEDFFTPDELNRQMRAGWDTL